MRLVDEYFIFLSILMILPHSLGYEGLKEVGKDSSGFAAKTYR